MKVICPLYDLEPSCEKKSIKKSHEPKQITMVFLGLRHPKLIFFLYSFCHVMNHFLELKFKYCKKATEISNNLPVFDGALKESGRLFWIILAFSEYFNFTREYILTWLMWWGITFGYTKLGRFYPKTDQVWWDFWCFLKCVIFELSENGKFKFL